MVPHQGSVKKKHSNPAAKGKQASTVTTVWMLHQGMCTRLPRSTTRTLLSHCPYFGVMSGQQCVCQAAVAGIRCHSARQQMYTKARVTGPPHARLHMQAVRHSFACCSAVSFTCNLHQSSGQVGINACKRMRIKRLKHVLSAHCQCMMHHSTAGSGWTPGTTKLHTTAACMHVKR